MRAQRYAAPVSTVVALIVMRRPFTRVDVVELRFELGASKRKGSSRPVTLVPEGLAVL